MKRTWMMVLMLALVAGLTVGCGDAAEEVTPDNGADNNGGGKTDEIGTGPCQGLVTSEEGQKLDMSQRNDVLARTVLRTGDDCPTTYAEVIAKLRKFDTDESRCKEGGGATDGINTMIVSESSQLQGEPTGVMRAVVTRQCNGRKQHELFFSLFGIHPDRPVPSDVEVMSFDVEAGEYNYYALKRGQWTWFGTSLDLMTAIENGDRKRCAACHTGGGPIMKELDTPWMHWEGHEDVPGARDLVDKHDDLGTKSSGSKMESLTKAGNRAWNPTRVAAAAAKGNVAALLRPLFCTVEVNIDNGSDFKSSTMSRINFDFLFDPQLKGFGSISVKEDEYQAALKEHGQFMSSDGSNAIEGEDGEPVRDTIFRFAYPERAFADNNYVDELKKAGLVDDDFIKDVLMIDFTRPIYSEDRCALLAFAPEGLEAPLDAAKIRDGFIASLDAAGVTEGTPEAQLLTHLKDVEDGGGAHKEAVEAFITACKARESKDFMNDALLVAIQRRDIARDVHHSVFEFSETMPFSEFEVDTSFFLHPETCVLGDSLETGGEDEGDGE